MFYFFTEKEKIIFLIYYHELACTYYIRPYYYIHIYIYIMFRDAMFIYFSVHRTDCLTFYPELWNLFER